MAEISRVNAARVRSAALADTRALGRTTGARVNLRELDLNLLLVFRAVLRRHSATLAGEDLDMTQSAISNALRRLRLHFSDPLFVKTAQGMTPTVLAEKLAGPLLEALERIEATVQSVQAFDPARSERRFHVYTSDVGQLILVPRLLRVLDEQAPRVAVEIVDVPARLAPEMMIEGAIDIAIGSFANLDAGFHRQRLFSKAYMAIARPGHAALKGGLTLDKFLRARHARYNPPAASHDDFDELVAAVYRQHAAKRRVVVELAHGLGIAEVVASSDLIACVPRRLAERLAAAGQVETAPLPFESPSVDVNQYWHERHHADDGHRWFRHLVYRAYSAM
jgi:DNA-binding transcriptional LysR family regulator